MFLWFLDKIEKFSLEKFPTLPLKFAILVVQELQLTFFSPVLTSNATT